MNQLDNQMSTSSNKACCINKKVIQYPNPKYILLIWSYAKLQDDISLNLVEIFLKFLIYKKFSRSV